MADAHSTRKCKTCGIEFKAEQRAGRPPVNCHACKRQKAHSNLSAGLRNCVTCGKEFSAKANQKHCSDVCRNGTKMTREQYRESVRLGAKYAFKCINCGNDAYRRPGGNSLKRGYENKYCSRDCMREHLAKASSEKQAAELLLRNEIRAIKRLGKATYKPTLKRCNCKTCGTKFIAKLGGGLYKQKCNACLDEVAKRARRIHKSKRRAACRGVSAESIDPIKVFDRDKWQCKLCGKRTPKLKRGTYEDDAPELDHIVPLSKGGAHSYANTQCACRKCNRVKAGRPLGQMLLIG